MRTIKHATTPLLTRNNIYNDNNMKIRKQKKFYDKNYNYNNKITVVSEILSNN